MQRPHGASLLTTASSTGLPDSHACMPSHHRRIDGTRLVKSNNFGVLEVEWEAAGGPRLLFSIRGEKGEVFTTLTVPLSELRAAEAVNSVST